MTSSPRPIVYVTPVLPWPADQGSRLFQLEAARALASVGPVTWITRTLGDQSGAEAHLRAEGFELWLDRSFASRSPWARARRRVRIDAAARWRREPREPHFVSSPGIRARVREAARRMPEAWFVGAYWSTVHALREAPTGRRLLLAADVESVAAAKGLELAGSDGRARQAAARLRDAETKAFADVDHLLCLTAEDEASAARVLAERGGRRSPRIGRWPTGLPMPTPCPWPPAPEARTRLLLYGHWEADFNRDGLEWFVREVWPTVRAARPESRLRVVGRGAEKLRRPIEGVEWVGYVDDLRAELEACHAVLVPLRYAGGLRYRLIEALAFGRPVVCTPVAAAGAEAEAGRTHLEAVAPEQWIAALEALDDEERARSLRDTGRDWARRGHGIEPSREAVRALFDRLEAAGGSGT